MRYLAFLIAVIISSGIFGQQVKYSVVKDDPTIPHWLSLNLDVIGMEMSLPHLNAINTASFNVGVWGHVEPGIPVGIQYNFQRSWFVLGGFGRTDFPKNTDVQGGVYFFLSDKIKRKSLKVALKSEVSENYRDNTRTTTTTYITVDGNVRNQFGFRGGLLYKKTPNVLSDELENQPEFEEATHTSVALYAGILNRNTTNLVLDTDKYGRVHKASKANHFFLDAIITPVNQFSNHMDNNANITDEFKDVVSTFPLGARFGLQSYQIEKKAVTGKKFGMSSRVELGYRPYIGPYITASFGITVLKLQKAAKNEE